MNVRRPRRPSSGRLGQGAPCLRRLAARLRPPIHPPSLLPVQQRGRLRTHTERETHTPMHGMSRVPVACGAIGRRP